MSIQQFSDQLAAEHGPKFAHVTVIAANADLFLQALQSVSMSPRDAITLIRLFSDFSAQALATLTQEMDLTATDIIAAADRMVALHQTATQEPNNGRPH